MIDPAVAMWAGSLLVGAAGGFIVAVANIIQTRVAGKQAIELVSTEAAATMDRQHAIWARQDELAKRMDRSDSVSADQFLQLLRQGAETKGLVNYRLTIALQAQLLALQGTLEVMSEKTDPSDIVKARIAELRKEIYLLQEELTLRDIQQQELDTRHSH